MYIYNVDLENGLHVLLSSAGQTRPNVRNKQLKFLHHLSLHVCWPRAMSGSQRESPKLRLTYPAIALPSVPLARVDGSSELEGQESSGLERLIAAGRDLLRSKSEVT